MYKFSSKSKIHGNLRTNFLPKVKFMRKYLQIHMSIFGISITLVQYTMTLVGSSLPQCEAAENCMVAFRREKLIMVWMTDTCSSCLARHTIGYGIESATLG